MKEMNRMIFLLLFSLSAACTPLPPGQEQPAPDLDEAEGDFDPLAQDAKRPIVIRPAEGKAVGDSLLQAEEMRPGLTEDLTGVERSGVTQGYRVQIFLSDDLREASRVMAEARERFEEPVYLEYDAPYYKVRVGDCTTEEQGDELRKLSRRLGYPDAWLVRTIISVGEEH